MQSVEVWTGTTYALAAALLSVGLKHVKKNEINKINK